jgi:hypothetical protein
MGAKRAATATPQIAVAYSLRGKNPVGFHDAIAGRERKRTP